MRHKVRNQVTRAGVDVQAGSVQIVAFCCVFALPTGLQIRPVGDKMPWARGALWLGEQPCADRVIRIGEKPS